MKQKTLKWIFQLVATAVLLYLALNQIETENIRDIIREINPRPLLFIPFLLFLDLVVNSYRIVSLYRFYGVKTALPKVISIKLQGMFFSLLFPLLGDAYKIRTFKTAYGSGYGKNSMVVLLDRLIYTFALSLMLTPILLLSVIDVHPALVAAMAGLLLLEVVILVLLNSPGIFLKISLWLQKIHKGLARLPVQFDKRSGYTREIINNTAIAIGRHGIMAVIYLCAAYAITGDTTLAVLPFFLVVFFIMISRVVPVSVGGIGLREYIAVMVFPQIGVAATHAFSIAFFISTLMVVMGLIGGLHYLYNRIIQNPFS